MDYGGQDKPKPLQSLTIRGYPQVIHNRTSVRRTSVRPFWQLGADFWKQGIKKFFNFFFEIFLSFNFTNNLQTMLIDLQQMSGKNPGKYLENSWQNVWQFVQQFPAIHTSYTHNIHTHFQQNFQQFFVEIPRKFQQLFSKLFKIIAENRK